MTDAEVEAFKKQVDEQDRKAILSLPYLHIYGQGAWHDYACIIGNTLALKALRNAIDVALESGAAGLTCFPNDGEGFYLAVARSDDSQEFMRLRAQYTDEVTAGSCRKGTICPYDIERIDLALRSQERD